MKTLSTSLPLYIYMYCKMCCICVCLELSYIRELLTQKQLPVLQAALFEQYLQTLLNP